MKTLSGSEIVEYVKQRQIHQVRSLRQAQGKVPKLVILVCKKDPIIDIYTNLKKAYGEDILVEVEIINLEQNELKQKIEKLNKDSSVHGIVVQLPLEDMEEAGDILKTILPEKDVDGLGVNSIFDPATPQAINWLLAGYNIELKDKCIRLIGRGRLVGEPLEKMWLKAGYDIEAAQEGDDLQSFLKNADIIVTATGKAGLVTSQIVPIGAVVVDAGVSTEKGKILGDLAEDIYNRDDLTVTPRKGGVGPLTVAVLFENVIRATSLAG